MIIFPLNLLVGLIILSWTEVDQNHVFMLSAEFCEKIQFIFKIDIHTFRMVLLHASEPLRGEESTDADRSCQTIDRPGRPDWQV